METIELQDLFIATMSGAAIVLTGALYALFYALAKLHHSQVFHFVSLASFVLLTIAVYFLAISLQLTGFWIWALSVMVFGYFVAPRFIWRLCVATHEEGEDRAAQ